MFTRIKPCLVSVFVLCMFSIGWQSPAAVSGLRSAVSMSLLDTRLFVSDSRSGIHVYDVTDVDMPRHQFTIPLYGNRSTAARGDIVYANDSRGLHVIRVTETSWEIVKTIHQVPEPEPIPDIVLVDGRNNGFGCACNGLVPAETPAGVASPSTGSSFATFAVIDDYLYYVDGVDLVTMDISAPEDPVEIARFHINWTVETLFPTANFLFVGGTRGMYIFDRSAPATPVLVSSVQHFRACDPVVVWEEMAYVTLRGDNRCGDSPNVLLSISIADPKRPVIVGERTMDPPWGLTVNEALLYVSTGPKGFELLDIATPKTPVLVKKWYHGETRDFIWDNDRLYVMGTDDVSLYDVTAPNEPILRSRIE